MAIRFACPSCQQPIEIDDQWAGQSVGCPYCKKVVTAPPSSTWPPGEVPVASPAGSAFRPPPPPGDQAQAPVAPATAASPYAAWGLTLSLTCAVLCTLGMVVWFGQFGLLAVEKLGDNPHPTREETQKAQQEIMEEIIAEGRYPTNTFSTAAALIGALCGLGGLVLAVRSLLRQERRRGMAIAACLIGACFVVCQLPLLAVSCVKPPSPPLTPSAESAPADPGATAPH